MAAIRRTVGRVGVAFLVIMALLGAFRAFSRSIIYPGSAVAFPAEDDRLEILEYRSSDGIDLRAGYLRADRSGESVVVYFHGNAESAADNLDIGAFLASRNLNVLLPEYRGYGGVGGSPTEDGLYEDGLAAIQALSDAGVAPSRIVLVGRSLGTGVAMEMAARGHGRALILVAPCTSIIDLGRRMVGPLAPVLVPDRFDNMAKAASVKIPAVVIHGTADEVVPFVMGKAIADRLPKGRLVALHGVGHNDIHDLPEIVAREAARLLGG
jgi:fermentation-respiration switch protein FrsA (DUF1100 family)